MTPLEEAARRYAQAQCKYEAECAEANARGSEFTPGLHDALNDWWEALDGLKAAAMQAYGDVA
jgi:hypothetical protein